MRIVFIGATGLIGRRALVQLARGGHELVAIVRRPASSQGLPCAELPWPEGDLAAGFARAFAGADAVVNLAGEPIGTGRWSPARKRAIPVDPDRRSGDEGSRA
jgi:uncharacterized protein